MDTQHAHHPSHDASGPDSAPHAVSHSLTRWAVGAALVGGAVMLAPHMLPAMGIGSAALAEESMWVLHTSAEAGGSGMAGLMSRMLGSIPFIGSSLAAGGLFSAAATGLTGIGGVLLGNYIEKKEGADKRVKWGSLLKYAALITSAIVALPTVLTAIGSGLIYLSTLVAEAAFTNSVIGFIGGTIGTMAGAGYTMMGFSGMAAVVPHLLTCGVSVLPAALAYSLPSGGRQPVVALAGDGDIAVAVETAAPAQAHAPCQVRLRLTHRDTGRPLTAEELAVVHTEKLHLFVVDTSLKDYQHIHPKPTQEPGVFTFSFTPAVANGYCAWADFTLLKDRKNHRVKAAIPSTAARSIPPVIRVNNEVRQDGLRFEWQGDPLRQGGGAVVTLRIADESGRVVTDLEPLMGAFAHLVGFSSDGQSIIHSHPLGAEPSRENERGQGHLRFHIEPHCAGDTQFYLQIKRGGQEHHVAFGQRIKAAERVAQRQTADSHSRQHAFGHMM